MGREGLERCRDDRRRSLPSIRGERNPAGRWTRATPARESMGPGGPSLGAGGASQRRGSRNGLGVEVPLGTRDPLLHPLPAVQAGRQGACPCILQRRSPGIPEGGGQGESEKEGDQLPQGGGSWKGRLLATGPTAGVAEARGI